VDAGISLGTEEIAQTSKCMTKRSEQCLQVHGIAWSCGKRI
jgi:hypothetical protein